MFEIGERAYLARDIITEDSEESPAATLGFKGEKVFVCGHRAGEKCLYIVTGPTNEGKRWFAGVDDLMRTKPMRFNS